MLFRSFRLTLLLLLAVPLFAQENVIPQSTDPLRLIPHHAVALFHCQQPKRVIEQLFSYARQLELTKFDEVREFLGSTPMQRFDRFVRYLEQQYDRKWDKLLDDISGHGLAFALIPDSNPRQPQLLGIMQARDASLLKRIYAAALDVLKHESQNSDQPEETKSKAYRDILVTSVGDKLFVAQHQLTFLITTHSKTMANAIDQLLDGKKMTITQHKQFVATERPSSADVLAWGWVNLAHFKDIAKDDLQKFKLPTNDLIPHLLFGGLLDAVLRSDHAWFSLRAGAGGPRFEITTPSGRSVSQEGARQLHMHDPAREPILPLLNPPGTVYSNSFYWNLAALWNERTKIYQAGALKDFEESDKNVRPFLAGNSLSSLFTTLGTRHRIVVARQRDTGYTIKARNPYPAFAFVAECTEPEQFNKLINVPLRTAGFLFSTQVSMKLFEDNHNGCKISGYRFNEVEKNKAYEQGLLFNYTPCFTRVGNFFVISSTRELCKDLVDELKKPHSTSTTEAVDMHHRFSWVALGEAIAYERPRVTTELTLRHGGEAGKVDEQITHLLKLLYKLGTLDFTISHSPGFRLELRTNYK